MYNSNLRRGDAVLAILCTGLPIPTTIPGKWLNSSIFNDDNKCITANGQTLINVGADNICQVTIIHYAQFIFDRR